MNCWQCGVAPNTLVDTSALSSGFETRMMPGRWPPGDHEHAIQPPAAAELLQSGHATLERIYAIAAE
jgi:hypothetical protein